MNITARAVILPVLALGAWGAAGWACSLGAHYDAVDVITAAVAATITVTAVIDYRFRRLERGLSQRDLSVLAEGVSAQIFADVQRGGPSPRGGAAVAPLPPQPPACPPAPTSGRTRPASPR